MLNVRPGGPEDGRCQSCFGAANMVIEAQRPDSNTIVEMRLCGGCYLALASITREYDAALAGGR